MPPMIPPEDQKFVAVRLAVLDKLLVDLVGHDYLSLMILRSTYVLHIRPAKADFLRECVELAIVWRGLLSWRHIVIDKYRRVIVR